MYTRHNIVSYLLADAAEFMIRNDRELYSEFFKRAEDYAIDKSMVIGGKVGNNMLVNMQRNKDSYYWELFSTDAETHSKELTDILYETVSKHISSATVLRLTNIYGAEYTISINNRFLFKIYRMDQYRGVSLMEVMKPATRVGYFTSRPFKVMAEDIQLIELYRTLYSPAKQGLWAENIEIEEQLFSTLRYLHQKYTGGAGKEKPICNVFTEAKRMGKELVNLCNGTDRILIGDYALKRYANYIVGKEPPALGDNDRIQLLTSEDPEELERVIADFTPRGFKITTVRYNVNLPYDFRIVKHAYYITDGTRQVSLLDTYNCPAYEIIPTVVSDNLRIGSHFVLMRFKLIDLWLLRLIGSFSPQGIQADRLSAIVAQMGEFRTLYMGLATGDLFPTYGYIGRVTNETVAKRALGKGGQQYHPGYKN